MRRIALKCMIVSVFASAFLLSALPGGSVHSQSPANAAASEAPTGFDGQTNGLIPQGVAPQEGAEAVRGDYENDKAVFDEVSEIKDGLGPVYNAQSCRECHQNPTAGGASQVAVVRAGRTDDAGNFVEAAGGSLVNDRAVDPSIQEYCTRDDTVRAFRISPSVLGDGYVEAIADSTLLQIAAAQPSQSGGRIAGQAVKVPVLEAPGRSRVGRFGWKDQQASLLSFASDAYLNEIGITNRLNLTENTSMGRSVAAFDAVSDLQPCKENPSVLCGEDTNGDIETLAEFMRATKAPPRDTERAATAEAQAGSRLFRQVGCAVCHVASITTAAPGAVINGGTFNVPEALGNKVIHPFGDFLLHDVGTGDGIVQNGGQVTAYKLRTPPLWGLRARPRLMHDGQSLTRADAIRRHGGEAAGVINNYTRLTAAQKAQLLAFLDSL